jgi:diguanylate cyclase (GGDEF)-like protein/PAS domain S-box-containing protein
VRTLPQYRTHFTLGIIAAVLLATGVSIYGWLTGNQHLVQVAPGLAPIQFNTALGLTCLAVSVALLHLGSRKLCVIAASLAGLIASLALSEYLPGPTPSIDQLFVKSTLVTVQSPLPGRMAPTTAILMLTLSMCYLAHAFVSKGNPRCRILAVCSTFVGLVSLVLLVSALTHLGVVYELTQFNQMAVQTGLCLTLLSAAGLVSSGSDAFKAKNTMVWISASAVFGLSAGTLIWLQAEVDQEARQIAVTTYERADGIRYNLESAISKDGKALRRLANRMSLGLEPSWDEDVSWYLQDCPEFAAIGWVGRNGSTKWTSDRNSGWTGIVLTRQSQSRLTAATTRAKASRDLTASQPIDLGRLGPGFVVYAPIFRRGQVVGLVAGVFKIETLIKSLFARTQQRYRLEVIDSGRSLYLLGTPSPARSSPVNDMPISAFGSKWSIRTSPNQATLSKFVSPLPKLIAICGIITSMLVGYLILLAHKARTATVREKESRRFLENLSEASMTLTYIVDLKDTKLIYCNQYGANLIGLKDEELSQAWVGIFQRRVHSGDLAETLDHFQHLDTLLEGQIIQIERRLMCSDDRWHWILHRECVHTWDADGTPRTILGVGNDITEQKEASIQLQTYALVLEVQKEELQNLNGQLETMATTDGLTGVFNRRRFDGELSLQMTVAERHALPLSVILVDIDKFKTINDVHGHLVGDAVLRRLASILKQEAREGDFVARYGGEEFAIICPHTDLESGALFAERLRESIASTLFESGTVTASFGVASLSLNDTAESLLANADAALYQSKGKGRNCVTTFAVVAQTAA